MGRMGSTGWTNDSIIAYPAPYTAPFCNLEQKFVKIYGVSLGEEARYRRKDILLGPWCKYLQKLPLNGRNLNIWKTLFNFSNGGSYIKGLQSNGVAACVKHYALNNQETYRHTSNVIVDDRTLYEIYLPPFKAAVQDGDS